MGAYSVTPVSNFQLRVIVILTCLAIPLLSSPTRAEQQLTVIDPPDELTAAYFAAVADNLTDPDVFQPAAVSAEVLDGWEDRFGNDPRYWELRYFCAKLDPVKSRGSKAVAEDYLVKPSLQEMANWEEVHVIKPYAFSLLNESFGELIEAIPSPEWSAEWHAGVAAIHAKHEGYERKLLDAAVRLGPDQAWPRWQRGMYFLGLGETEPALADLRAGNNAEFNVVPYIYPESLALDHLAAGEVIGSLEVHGAVVAAIDDDPRIVGSLWYRERAKELLVMGRLGAGPELTAAYFTMGCRMACAERTRPLDIVMICDWLEIPLSNLLTEQADGLTADERRLVLEAYTDLQSARVVVNGHQTPWQTTADYAAADYAMYCRYTASELALVNKQLKVLFARLGQLNLAGLETPDGWLAPFV